MNPLRKSRHNLLKALITTSQKKSDYKEEQILLHALKSQIEILESTCFLYKLSLANIPWSI